MFDTGFEELGDLQGARKGFRAGRGMMEPAILGALSIKPMHGYEVIAFLEEKTHGIWRPSAGSVYPTLQLLEEKDLVACTESDGKKVYKLTQAGEAEATASQEHLHSAFERLGHDEGRRMNLRHEYQRHFHKQAGEIAKVIRLIFRKGTAEQKGELDGAIKEFKARVEQIWEGEAK